MFPARRVAVKFVLLHQSARGRGWGGTAAAAGAGPPRACARAALAPAQRRLPFSRPALPSAGRKQLAYERQQEAEQAARACKVASISGLAWEWVQGRRGRGRGVRRRRRCARAARGPASPSLPLCVLAGQWRACGAPVPGRAAVRSCASRPRSQAAGSPPGVSGVRALCAAAARRPWPAPSADHDLAATLSAHIRFHRRSPALPCVIWSQLRSRPPHSSTAASCTQHEPGNTTETQRRRVRGHTREWGAYVIFERCQPARPPP